MFKLEIDREFWRGRRVLVTGHTGFKGAWLTFWLKELGAKVTGFSLAPASSPNMFTLLNLEQEIDHIEGDVTDIVALDAAMQSARPEVVFHLAAQALVRASYSDPVGTFATNVVGVAAVLDRARSLEGLLAIVVVTSDKCYENREWPWPYRETDTLGGHDPYSASKAAAEIVADSMRKSYYSLGRPARRDARIATVRAGNVIGGGDWATDRLVPDIIRGCMGSPKSVLIRNPDAVRPWQHVLEPLSVYIGLAQLLSTDEPGVDEAWNVGPLEDANKTVLEAASELATFFPGTALVTDEKIIGHHEANLLRLDCAKIVAKLGWAPTLGFSETMALTAKWYAAWGDGHDMANETRIQLEHYCSASAQNNINQNNRESK